MNGWIGLESSLGQGSTFRVTLKFQRQFEAEISSPDLYPFANLPVLIVGSNETSQAFVQRQINGWGLEGRSAKSANEALAILHQSVAENTPYRLAIIDLVTTEMDDLSLVQQINAEPGLGKTRLILLTPFGKPVPAATSRRLNLPPPASSQSDIWPFSIVSFKYSPILRFPRYPDHRHLWSPPRRSDRLEKNAF